ncbi:MAG TPA: hypothetical protein VL463_14715 [Kofleriaceae bacterium]|nr:hypothetical protein [Kofleriaceae bacterium]
MRIAPALLLLACCGPGEVHVTLDPVPAVAGCGRIANAQKLLVSALGDFPSDTRQVDVGAAVDLATFPPETRQLAVEVLGPGGVKAAVGATAPLQLAELAEGEHVPIFMAPKDGFCRTSSMSEPRDRPLIVRAGAGVLVIGGLGASGPVKTAEYYDPATATFTPVTVPTTLAAMGFTGATATELADGRAVIAGGPPVVYGVFDPKTLSFGRPGTLLEVRAYHAAAALDGAKIIVAGGCGFLGATGMCAAGSERTTTKIIDVDSGDISDGPALGGVRLGGTATLEASGADLTGAPEVLLAGGIDLAGNPVATIERFDPSEGAPAAIATPGAAGLTAPLAAGGVLVALASPGAPAAGGASVVAPGTAPHVVGAASARAGAVLVPLEDGTVAAIGGRAGTAVDRYLPALRAWKLVSAGAASDAPDGVAGSGAVRLDDGSVLVVGGHDSVGAPLDQAWIYRPAVDRGPFDAATVTPTDEASAQLDPLDPANVNTTSGDWILSSSGPALASWAVIAGPSLVSGTITASVRPSGGVAILVGFVDPSHFDALVLPMGGAAHLERHTPGAVTPLCTGSPVPMTLGEGGSVTITVTRKPDRISATVGADAVIDCAPGTSARGRVGIAPSGSGASLTVDTISVNR